MDTAYDVIVAGGGIAGLTAGMESARLGRSTLVLTGDVLGGHLLSIEKIEGFPGYADGIAGYELCPLTQGQAAEAGAAFQMAELDAIEPDGDGWRVATRNGAFAARAVIVATGTVLKSLGVPGEERLRGKGVSHCASCDAPLLRGKPVAVVGGGDSAMQEALTLAEAASRVVMIHRGAELTGQASFRDRVAAHANIAFRFDTVVEAVLGDDGVTGVRIAPASGGATEDLEAAGLFVYVGLQPVAAFLDGRLERAPSGHVPTDGALRTVLPGVFAAGTVRDGAPGRAVSAAGEGTAAAIAADRYLTDGAWRT